MGLCGVIRDLLLIGLLAPATVHGQGSLEARYMIALGASSWQHSGAAWGGSLEVGVFPGESFVWQVLGYVTHSPPRTGVRSGITTFGAELLLASGERRGGEGLRYSVGGGAGVLRYAEDSADSYYHGWRATLSISARPEIWLSTRLGLFGSVRFLLPFAGQGSADDLQLLFSFGIAWRW